MGNRGKLKFRGTVPLLVFLIFCVLASLTAPFSRWPWSHIPSDFRMPLLGFLANLVLVGVTWVYVLVTHEQLRELQSGREPNVVLNTRVPEWEADQKKYGRGNNQYREGPPIYLDVWNFGAPTIMVTRVFVTVAGNERQELLLPQVLVEKGKVAPINVAYHVMRLFSTGCNGAFDFPAQTLAESRFDVDYFSMRGNRRIHASQSFGFYVGDNFINTHRLR